MFFQDKCYRAFEERVPYNNYVCDGLKGFVYSVKSFDTASEYRFLKSHWDLEKFWPVQTGGYSTKKYGEFCRKDVGWECPEKGIYLDKWSKERGEGGEGIKIKN
jgi:hypothetical protein